MGQPLAGVPGPDLGAEWDEADRRYGRKVTYWIDGVQRTAYLDTHLGGDLYSGTEKHTDAPVTVRWTGLRYEEVRS